jgi:penicillin-binding protein 1A
LHIIKKKKEGNNKDNLLERKEVEFVSSSSRRGKVNDDKNKKKKVKPQNKKQANKSRDKKEKSSSKKKGIVRKILTILLGFAIFCVFAATAFMIYIVVSTSNFDPNALVNQDQTVLYDKDGKEFATLGVQKRESVTYDQLPQVLVDAIVATEDSRYYQHNGVDMARFLKATALNLIGRDDAGGASTLTMQKIILLKKIV